MTKRNLTPEDAIEIWILRWRGKERHAIVREFDQNPMRIYEIWQEDTFKGSREEAEIIFRTQYPELVPYTDFSPHVKSRKLVKRKGAEEDPRQPRFF